MRSTVTSIKTRGLNPHAPAFIPTVLTLSHEPERAASAACQQQHVDFLSLAPDVLECVYSHLHHPEDVLALAATCKRLSTAATTAPLHLHLASPRCSSYDSRTLGAVLTTVCRRFSATRTLDLSGTCVEDADVLTACRLLRGLQHLQLANCRKITDALFLGGAHGTPLSTDTAGVQVLGLQRCFQMTHQALAAIMQAPVTPLMCLVMSHLELHACPARHTPTPPTTLPNLRMLALLNSTLDAAALRTLGGCTALRYLFLGGSLDTPPHPADPPPDRHASLLRILDADSALRSALHAAVHVNGMRRCDQQQQPALALALELAVLLQQLRHVHLLEATFTLRGVLPALRVLLGCCSIGLHDVQLLDLTSSACVVPLLQLHADAQAQPTSGLTTALQAAACCSSPTRHTPLHLASHDGNSQLVTALLRCGARWDLRDRGGNTPLFLACELGHAAVVDALLEAGPDAALVKNNAGELPLYIAALRGHQRCVSRLITNWQTMGVLWQLPAMYSEGWTPLHAAVVGNHGPLVHQLLRLAGPLAGPMVASTNRNGQTVLHVAACTGSVNMLRILLEVAGAPVLATADSMGRTALQIAQKSGNRAAAELLSCRTQQHKWSGQHRTMRKQQHTQEQQWAC